MEDTKMASKENLKALLRKYTDVVAPSGHEQAALKVIHAELKGHADEIKVSTTGNMVAVKKGARPGPTIAIGAHMDEVGYVIRSILPSGFLLFDKVGTQTDNVAIGRKVWVTAKKIPGIITIKPGHLATPDEAKLVTPISKLFIDLGCKSAEEVKKLGIKIGDPIVPQSDFMEMSNPDLICTKAIDDRINCAIITELFKTIKAEDFAGTLLGVFTVREEPGMHGAVSALFNYDVDYCLSLDTIPTNDTPDGNVGALPLILGNGPGLSVCDGIMAALTFYVIHPGVRSFIESIAAKTNINLQTVTLIFAGYATDAANYQKTKGGIPTATLTVPRRYSHSPVDLCDINDADKLFTLLLALIKENDKVNLNFADLG
jgi:endoglucanase